VRRIKEAEMDLESLVTNGEGQTTEFKKSLSLKKEALEALCSMVNANVAQGTVIFGVGPDGTACGIEPGNLDKAQLSLSQIIKSNFDPPLQAEIYIGDLEGKRLLLITARRLRSIPYHEYDGRAWIRQGSAKRLLTLAEKDHLRKTRDRALHPGPWKCDRCGDSLPIFISVTTTSEGSKRDYGCDCGGEYWPST
jgi:predicted HTH transcriptional regulator